MRTEKITAAMDVKNSRAKYAVTIGLNRFDTKNIEESIDLLKHADIDYEFRTTVAEPLHDEQSMEAMAQWLIKTTGGKLVKAHYLQAYVHRDTVCFEGLSAPAAETLERFKNTLVRAAKTVDLRGV